MGDPIYCRPPGAKLESATRGHRHLTKGAELSRIVIGFDRSPSVPGLKINFNLEVLEALYLRSYRESQEIYH